MQSSYIRVFGRTSSFNVQKVLWFLDELNLSYEHIQLGGKYGGLESAEFSSLTPVRKVPLLLDGDRPIWESHTILRYLAANYGGKDWFSEDSYERSLYERWMDWAQCKFQPAFMDTFWSYYRKSARDRNMDEIDQALALCHECLGTINTVLNQKEYLLGSKPTLADVCVGSILYRLTSQGLDVKLAPNVARWYKALKNRKGYQKWIMSDFSELKGRQVF